MTQMHFHKTETDSQAYNRLVAVKGKGGGRGMCWESGVGRGKLLYIGWINNRSTVEHRGIYSIFCDKTEIKKRLVILKQNHKF